MPYRKGQPKWVRFHGRKTENQRQGESDEQFAARIREFGEQVEQELAAKERTRQDKATARLKADLAREEREEFRQRKAAADAEIRRKKELAREEAKRQRDERRRQAKARRAARKAGYRR